MNRESQSSCDESPNEPKLSDGGGWQPLCGDADGGEGGGSIGADSRSRSMQRMVRRCGRWLKPPEKSPPKFILDDRVVEHCVRIVEILERPVADDTKESGKFSGGYRIAFGCH